jgi:hypothetical protein
MQRNKCTETYMLTRGFSSTKKIQGTNNCEVSYIMYVPNVYAGTFKTSSQTPLYLPVLSKRDTH